MKTNQREPSVGKIHIANPLPDALAHYLLELTETLDRVGAEYDRFPTRRVESDGRMSKLALLWNAVSNSIHARRASHSVLLTWPSLGLLDARLWSTHSFHKNVVVLHDPIPIRKQVGYDRVSNWCAKISGKNSPVILTHSIDAFQEASRLLPRHDHIRLPHPILTKQRKLDNIYASPTVVVAGQFKPERDLGLLRAIGLRLSEIGATGKIYGRGWPDIAGWTVESRFLTETELDQVLTSASVVLIPYNRYFQSGISIRALELGTMSISPENSFAREVLGPAGVIGDSENINSWMKEIVATIETPNKAVRVFREYSERVDSEWASIFSVIERNRSSFRPD